jgi:striatin 1/3/4
MLGSLQGIPSNNQQQQQLQPQQQNQQHQPGQQGTIPPPPPQNGQDFTLSSVLHYLQTEWRRYERDRNEWEIERAEMRVCISFLLSSLVFIQFHCRHGSLCSRENEDHSKMLNLIL